MDRLPLIRVAEVAFLASNVKECIDFYRKIGMADLPASPGRLNFARVGEQLYGVCDGKIGFLTPGQVAIRKIGDFMLRSRFQLTS